MSTLYEIFIGPFSEFEFMQRALLAGIAVGIFAPLIGISPFSWAPPLPASRSRSEIRSIAAVRAQALDLQTRDAAAPSGRP